MPDNLKEQDRQGNVKQNTTNPGLPAGPLIMAKDRSPDRSHGGPGSSHQDATQPKPEADERHGPEPRQRRTPDRSRVSGGGGERDKHHTHDPRTKS